VYRDLEMNTLWRTIIWQQFGAAIVKAGSGAA
jgi:hypothetical protein